MRITAVPGRLLTTEHRRIWTSLIAHDPILTSPFLRPEFTIAAASVRDDVYVGLLEDAHRIVGFFPHQRTLGGLGSPVGGELNDLQGIVVDAAADWHPSELLRGCGLVQWTFERLLGSQQSFAPYHLRPHASVFIDLSGGYDGYLADKRRAGVNFRRVQHLARKTAHLARDVGPIRFEARTGDQAVLAALMRWRYERYAGRGYADLYAIGWARRLYEHVLAADGGDFGGTLSALYAGDRLVAAHLGIRSHLEWHSWACAYNPEYAQYSPGLLLFLRMIEYAPTIGIRRIELGGGGYPYKLLLANTAIMLAEGVVDRVPVVTAARRWRRSSEAAIRQSPYLHPPARVVNRALQGVVRFCRRPWAP